MHEILQKILATIATLNDKHNKDMSLDHRICKLQNNLKHIIQSEKNIQKYLQKFETISPRNFDDIIKNLMVIYLELLEQEKFYEQVRAEAVVNMMQTLSDQSDEDDQAQILDENSIKKYVFTKQENVYSIAKTTDYIVTNWNYKGITILSKDLKLIENIFIDQELLIDKIYSKFIENQIALYCPENQCIIFIDLDKKDINKVKMSHLLEIDGSYLTTVYYWQHDTLFLQSKNNGFYSINISDKKISAIDIHQQPLISLDFSNYIDAIIEYAQHSEIISFFPSEYQFTYYNQSKGQIGFVDSKNKIHHVDSYAHEDIHNIYFVNNTFIVVRCNALEIIQNSIIKKLLKAKKSCEFRESTFDTTNNIVYVISRYWYESDHQETIYTIKI